MLQSSVLSQFRAVSRGRNVYIEFIVKVFLSNISDSTWGIVWAGFVGLQGSTKTIFCGRNAKPEGPKKTNRFLVHALKWPHENKIFR